MMGHFIVKIKYELYLDVEADSAIEAERAIESYNPRIVGDIDFTPFVAKTVKESVADNCRIKRFMRLCDLCSSWQRGFRRHLCEKCMEDQQ